MPPEIIGALILLATLVIGGIGRLTTAMVDRRVAKMKLQADWEREQLELKLRTEAQQRQVAYEEKMAELAEKADMRASLDRQSDNLTNLVDAFVDLVKTDNKKTEILAAHTRELTGNTEAVTHLERHVDQLAEIVTRTHSKSDAALKKADDVVKAVDRLYDLMMTKFPTDDKSAAEEAREVLIEVVNKVCDKRKGDSQELPPITAAPPAGESEAKDAA